MIGGFFAWWVGQLAEVLPPWLRRSAVTSADALVIAPTGPLDRVGAVSVPTSVSVSVRRNGKEALLGQFSLGSAALDELPRSPSRPAVLRLPRTEILEKTLSLPLAAQAELNQVLTFEMDRETPFAADEVYWNHRIEAVDRQNARLSVRLWLMPKANLAPLMAALAQAGIAPRWAEIADDPGGYAPGEHALLPLDGTSGHPPHGSRRLVWAAAACCAMLAASAVAIPFVQQAAQLSALDREVRLGQATAAEAEALRREIDRLSRTADLVRYAQDKAGRPIEVLAIVTRILPDDTYLTEIDLRQRKVTLSGRSAAAARLIGALAAEGKFRNPGFAAPVTRLELLRAEVFTIVAEMEPSP